MLKENIQVIKEFDIFDDLENEIVEIGVLRDAIHYEAIPDSLTLKNGKPSRVASNKQSKLSNLEIAEKLDNKFRFISSPKNSNIRKDLEKAVSSNLNDLSKIATKKRRDINNKRTLDLYSKVVKSPMVDGKYINTRITAETKGFNRGTMDTGQIYNNIETNIKIGK